MPRNQKLSGLLRDLAHLLEEEAARNGEFASRLDALLTPALRPSQSKISRVRGQQQSLVLPDVLSILEEKGEEEFRFWLRAFDLSTLKAIVKSNGFDVTRSSQKWSDPDKFINLITQQASARLRRGSGFLPLPASTDEKNDLADRRNIPMKKVTVYFFECFDIIKGQNIRSERPGTLEAITRSNGRPIMETALEIDEAEVDGNGLQRRDRA
jgi:hypothetical protein